MEVIILSGGLGNQLFTYAFYLAKKKNNSQICINSYSTCREHNGYELDYLFGIHPDAGFFTKNIVRLVRKILIFRDCKKGFRLLCTLLLLIVKMLGVQIIEEIADRRFNGEFLKRKKAYCLYYGVWPTEKYFSAIKDEVLNAFPFDKKKISRQTFDILHLIEKTNSVSIHVRRGDYVSENYNRTFGNICTLHYYDEAIRRVENRIASPVFFVFSDDMEWVQANMQIANANYIDWNTGKDSWQDMLLMSKCKHNIIANSTFSWWGAWLNQFPSKMVIAPSRFSNIDQLPDFIPDGWIIIDENKDSEIHR
jgi:hypothetical protein